ncbi:MAG: hypothetical protein LC775_09410, partial [Acidobacteria bacterium]|nr:hypothetical protein [Acidobacteriota bacterium]
PPGSIRESRPATSREAHVLRQRYLTGSVARSAIEHDQQMMVGICSAQFLQERFQTKAIHPGQVKAQALARCGVNRGVEVGPTRRPAVLRKADESLRGNNASCAS